MNDVKRQIEDAMAKAMREAIKEIPRKVKKGIESTVAQALGFTAKWGDAWEVDNCNGRNSTVSGLVSDNIVDKVTKMVHSLSKKVKLGKVFEKALLKDMIDHYQRHVKNSLYDAVQKMAEERAQELVEKILPDISGIDMSFEAMFNPEFGERPAEKLVMETHVEKEE